VRFEIIVITAALLAACSAKPQTGPLPDAELAPYQACATDADCTWITNGCCDCANGGTEIAVARGQEAAFRARFECTNLPCTTIGRTPECGTGTVACERARCVFRPAVE
jgi:hypothetical protein